MFADTDVDESVLILLDMDLDKDPECESPHHSTEPKFHGGEVAHIVRGPCDHIQGLRCAAWVVMAHDYRAVFCTGCHRIVPIEYIRFIEI